MVNRNNLSSGDEWPGHYRGYRLQVSPNGDVWWELYSGTDRLHLDPAPEPLAENLLEIKHLGGRVRVTESNDVLTLVENANDEYEAIWIGEAELSGELIPADDPEFGIEVQPDGLSPGDLWPSVYDGARYAYSGGERVWWRNPETHKRHPVETDLSADVFQSLRRFKPDGGSFRITPWGDLITVIPFHPTPERIENQFNELPRVVRNTIKLRKERGVERLPIYVGRIDGTPFEVKEPSSLTDQLTEEERQNLESWAQNLGATHVRSSSDHSTNASGDRKDDGGQPEDQPEDHAVDEVQETSDEKTDASVEGMEEDLEEIVFDDDPIEWQTRDYDIENSGDDGR